ncbi:MAG: class I SAM-dependent methyltransferase [Gaiellaceae bacterium]
MRNLRSIRRAKRFTARRLPPGAHRSIVGGYWDSVGKLQLDFLIGQGLEPTARFLDVGCGALRAGIHLVGYLDAGNYYGVDRDASVLEAGYEAELTTELRAKLPREHLRCTDRFDVDFGVRFDAAIAQSVFTHINLNAIRLCLYRLAPHMKVGGKFFATFSEAPAEFPLDGVLHEDVRGKPSRYTDRNPFWYWPRDLEWAAGFALWRFRYIGDWGHPRDQKMVEFLRTPSAGSATGG